MALGFASSQSNGDYLAVNQAETILVYSSSTQDCRLSESCAEEMGWNRLMLHLKADREHANGHSSVSCYVGGAYKVQVSQYICIIMQASL